MVLDLQLPLKGGILISGQEFLLQERLGAKDGWVGGRRDRHPKAAWEASQALSPEHLAHQGALLWRHFFLALDTSVCVNNCWVIATTLETWTSKPSGY